MRAAASQASTLDTALERNNNMFPKSAYIYVQGNRPSPVIVMPYSIRATGRIVGIRHHSVPEAAKSRDYIMM